MEVPRKVAIVGAGPVGALAGLYFSNAGWEVEIYEFRGDLRLPENRVLGTGKSINLTLSERGISGLRKCGDNGEILERVLSKTVPLYGRMIHSGRIGELPEAQKYDVHGRFTLSADRAKLNEQLLDALDQRSNVKLFFGHKLLKLRCDLNELELITRSNEMVKATADLVIGADGAHSAVRENLRRYINLDYQQTYIDTLWCEFTLPSDPQTGGFQISPDYIHIWPKHTYMFIAIPSPNYTFTCTLFMPSSNFQQIGSSRETFLSFFRANFEEVIGYIGEEKIVEQYFGNQHLPLISIKCGPYHYKDKVVIVGDAAHAMVPFYGQGMNAGFESVERLFHHISTNPNLESALANYTEERLPDAHAINELAFRNYIELRSSVTSPVYKARKTFEEAMYAWFPWVGVQTLYSMVSFSTRRYSEVVEHIAKQQAWEDTVAFWTCLVIIGLLSRADRRLFGIVKLGVWTAIMEGLRVAFTRWREGGRSLARASWKG